MDPYELMPPLSTGPARQTQLSLVRQLLSSLLREDQPLPPHIHCLLHSSTHFLVSAPGIRCHGIFFANDINPWNCKVPCTERDFGHVLVPPARFYGEETGLAWLEVFIRSQRGGGSKAGWLWWG